MQTCYFQITCYFQDTDHNIPHYKYVWITQNISIKCVRLLGHACVTVGCAPDVCDCWTYICNMRDMYDCSIELSRQYLNIHRGVWGGGGGGGVEVGLKCY